MLLIWAEKDNLLPLASLYTHFSESKRWRSKECKTKDFRGSDATAKAWLREDFTLKSVNALIHIFLLHSLYPSDRTAIMVRPCSLWQNRRATGARIWGSVRSKTIFGTSVIFHIRKQSTGLTFTTGSLSRDDFYKC